MNKKEWIFKVFISPKGEDVINNWIESNALSLKEKIRIRQIINHLGTQKDMRCRWFGSYKKYPYLYRIKLRFNENYYRLFGCFGPADNEFTLLIPAKKEAGRLTPKNAPEIAEARRKLIYKDRRYINDFV